jgi:hypothetical protein
MIRAIGISRQRTEMIDHFFERHRSDALGSNDFAGFVYLVCHGHKCLHSDPVLPDCAPGQTVRVAGRLLFREG